MECPSIDLVDIDTINLTIIGMTVDWTLHARSKRFYLISAKHPH